VIKKVKKSTQDYPVLGRWISWVDKPGSNQKIFYVLIILFIFKQYSYNNFNSINFRLKNMMGLSNEIKINLK